MGESAVAWALDDARRRGRIDEEVAGVQVVIRYHEGTLAALDAVRIEDSRREGSASAETPASEPLPHLDAYWFAWAAFHPATEVRGR